MPLLKRAAPFDDPDWVFELKYDGFRALAVIEHGRAQLLSRNEHPFASFSALAESISDSLPNTRAVIDGEICSLDRRGRPQFKNLLFRRGNLPCFFAFDLLTRDGRDLRTERLIDRKQELRRLLATVPVDAPLKYVDHVDDSGTTLFQRICELDLEGVVAKHKSSPYVTEREHSTWFKILNREYSQKEGREELFERERHSEPVAGWHSCALACAGVEGLLGISSHKRMPNLTNPTDHNKLVACLRGLAPSVQKSSDRAWHREPAVRVLDCVLSLNRDYDRFVVPKLDDFERNHSEIRTVTDLQAFIATYSSPAKFVFEALRYNDSARASTLNTVVNWLATVGGSGSYDTQLSNLEQWAAAAHPADHAKLQIRGFAVGGFQYLRMLFGANTTKPDIYILQFVAKCVGHSVTPFKAVQLLESAAHEAGIVLRDLDTTVWESSARPQTASATV